MKLLQIFTITLLVRILILAKIKSLGLNSTIWIFNIFWPVRAYAEDSRESPHSASLLDRNSREVYHAKLHPPESSEKKNFSQIYFSSWKRRGEIICLKECRHLKSAQISRPGLAMIPKIYKDYIPKVKEQHYILSSQLVTLINSWKILLTSLTSLDNPWKTANKWGTSQTLIDTSELGLANILRSMRTYKVIRADVGYKGTQLKLTLTLKGNQTVIFKPKRSKKTDVIEGDVYGGPDRHFGEIAAFHLGLILNLTMVPVVTGRRVHFREEILPVASRALAKTVFIRGMSTCFYGVCHYCRRESSICDQGGFIDGAAILWLPKHLSLVTYLHPWARTYDHNKLAKDFCQSVITSLEREGKKDLLLNIIDVAIFDFLIQNGDRHHFSLVSSVPDGAIVIMDNGKSFGDPLVDHLDILAPLLQCCRVHRRTLERLELLEGGGLSRAMDRLMMTDALYPVLTNHHLKALDRRLSLVLAAIRSCHQDAGDAIYF